MIATDLMKRRAAIETLRLARTHAYEAQTTDGLIEAVDAVLLCHPVHALTPPAPATIPPHTLETAACIWENILDRLATPTLHPLVDLCREAQGTWGLRLTAVGWVDALDADWTLADTDPITGQSGHYDKSFDWDFVPAWIDARVEWHEDGSLPTLKPKAVRLPDTHTSRVLKQVKP